MHKIENWLVQVNNWGLRVFFLGGGDFVVGCFWGWVLVVLILFVCLFCVVLVFSIVVLLRTYRRKETVGTLDLIQC